jgi:hypothetical protein
LHYQIVSTITILLMFTCGIPKKIRLLKFMG